MNVPVLNIGGRDYNVKDKEARNKIDDLKRDVTQLFIQNSSIIITTNSYINGITGARDTGLSGVSTDYIDISERVTNYIELTCSLNDVYGTAWYDKDKRYIGGIYGTNASTYGYEDTTTPQAIHIIVPDDAYYIRTGMRSSFYTDVNDFALKITDVGPIKIINDLKSKAEVKSKNLLDPAQFEKAENKNKYVNYGNGELYASADNSTSVTDLIYIGSENAYTYSTEGAVLQLAFYDAGGNYVSGLANSGVAIRLNLNSDNIPATAKYVRFTVLKDSISKTQLEAGGLQSLYTPYSKRVPADLMPIDTNIYVHPEDDLIEVLKNNQGKRIVLMSGTYDIEEIYKRHFGSTYFDDYEGYTSGDETVNGIGIGAGLPVFNNTQLIGTLGSKFIFSYSGENINVGLYFSCFATGDGAILDGIYCEANNVRYIVHDDFNASGYPYHTVFKNCLFLCNSSQCIGGGMGNNGVYEITDNIFKGSYQENVSYHNAYSSLAHNKLLFANNYFQTRLSIRYYGESTKVSPVIVSNNSFGTPIEYRAETPSSINENVEIIEINNIVRN